MNRLTLIAAITLIVLGALYLRSGRHNPPNEPNSRNGEIRVPESPLVPPRQTANEAPTPIRPGASESTVRSGRFDFFVLALSWSPGFCATQNERDDSGQCARNEGFVVHGLWPQFERGYPSNCDTRNREPNRAALESVRGLFPDDGLARYQWRKHGSCTGASPAEYFNDVRAARSAVTVPESYVRPGLRQTARSQDVKRAFVDSNRGLRADMIRVQCQRGQLQEVQICFDKTLRSFRACGDDMRDTCGFGEFNVTPGSRRR